MTEILAPLDAAQLSRWLDVRLDGDRALDPNELRRLARRIGRERWIWAPHARHEQHERLSVLLHRRDALDVWLICWLDAQETGLHDHDRSAGAFYVCEGALVEDVLRVDRGGALRTEAHRVLSGTSRGFDGGHVHGVRHLGIHPATSLHVYSPALRGMGHYEADAGGVLRRTHRSYGDVAFEP